MNQAEDKTDWNEAVPVKVASTPADAKSPAFVVVIAPENQNDDRQCNDVIRAHLVKSLNKEGIENAIITNTTMNDSQTSLKNKIENINVENLIVVVIADGFYCDNGEAIIFKDGYNLLDSFINPIIADAKREYNFILM